MISFDLSLNLLVHMNRKMFKIVVLSSNMSLLLKTLCEKEKLAFEKSMWSNELAVTEALNK